MPPSAGGAGPGEQFSNQPDDLDAPGPYPGAPE